MRCALKTQGFRAIGALVSAICMLSVLGLNAARAETATFTSSATLSDGEIAALSSAGDMAGAVLALNQSLTLLFDQPFGTQRSDTLTIATLTQPGSGSSLFSIRVGVYNNGSPITVFSRDIARAGNTIEIGNLFNNGCAAFGGCDFVEIVTTRTTRDQAGAEIDYVDINGQVVGVVAATPEPAVWLMMIAAFALIAWRAKRLRTAKSRPQMAAPYRSAVFSLSR